MIPQTRYIISSKSAPLELSLSYLGSHLDQSDITIAMSDHIFLFHPANKRFDYGSRHAPVKHLFLGFAPQFRQRDVALLEKSSFEILSSARANVRLNYEIPSCIRRYFKETVSPRGSELGK